MMVFSRFVLVCGAVLPVLGAGAGAQPLILRSQSRSVFASGMCCGQPSQTDTASETGTASVFDRSVSVGAGDGQYNYYSVGASQRTTIDAHAIFGRTSAGAMSRGLTMPASSDASSECGVVFALEIPCTYTFSAEVDHNAVYEWPTSFTLRRVNGATVFSGSVEEAHQTYTGSGALGAGEYQFALVTSVAGNQFGSSGHCFFNLTVAPNCDCHWNRDARLDSGDYFDFLTAFFADNADFNHSEATDSQDYFDFLGCFFGGCA